MNRRIAFACFACALLALALAVADTPKPTGLAANLTAGAVQLKSAGPMGFGPEGILFVGDSLGGSVVEIDTNGHTAASADARVNVEGIDTKIAAMLGVTPDQIAINDVK